MLHWIDVKQVYGNQFTSLKQQLKLWALRVERANKIKTKFQNSPPNYITVHWDGKILPTLNVRDSGIDRLPIVITSNNVDLLIGIPKMEKSTGQEQANAV